jgi:hypothetical protein
MIDGSKHSTDGSTSLKTRWIAICAGLTLVPGCFGITLFYLILPVLLVAGAIIAGRRPSTGRWLMWIGAFLLSVLVFPWCVVALIHPPSRVVFMIFACIASAIFLPLCDVMLIIDAFKARRFPPQADDVTM